MTYAEKLKKYRLTHFKTIDNGKIRHLSQKDMVLLIGCSRNSYYDWEHGITEPGRYYVKVIDKILEEG